MGYKLLESNEEFLICFKITIGRHQGDKQVFYYKGEMKMDFFKRWSWYFEYRAALLKVKFPKMKVWSDTTSYKKVIPFEAHKKKLKGIITSKKGKLTEFKKKLEKAKIEFDKKQQSSLFKNKLEDEPEYEKVLNKLKSLEFELKQSEVEYANCTDKNDCEVPKLYTESIIDKRKDIEFNNLIKSKQ